MPGKITQVAPGKGIVGWDARHAIVGSLSGNFGGYQLFLLIMSLKKIKWVWF